MPGVFQPTRQLKLSGKHDGEKIDAIILHIGQQAKALKICGGHGICLIDKNQDLFPLVDGFKQEFIERFKEVYPSSFLALRPLKLPDDFPEKLNKGHVGIRYQGDPVFFLIQ